MRHNVLVADDQEDEREVLADLLRRHHYGVVSAANGQEALELLRSLDVSRPDLVVLDLNMPVMDGWEFLHHVAHDPSLCGIPVLVVSGAPIVQAAVMVPGRVGFMSKPFEPLVILEAIADMLRHAPRPRTARPDAVTEPQLAVCELVPVALDVETDHGQDANDGGGLSTKSVAGGDVYWSPSMIP